MSYKANVYNVMIASPSDVAKERAKVVEALAEWNRHNTAAVSYTHLLPEKQHFDHQFKPVLSMIKPKMKKTYDVYSGIQIKVSSAVEDLEDIIEAYEDGDGKRYLKIRMDNDITFRTFERREGR